MTINGYGIELTSAAGYTRERLADFVRKHMSTLKGNPANTIKTASLLDMLNSESEIILNNECIACDVSGVRCLAAYVSNVITGETGVRISAYASDYCDTDISAGTIIFEENYPWCMTEFERNMTLQVLNDIFAKYLKELGVNVAPETISVEVED